MITHDTEGATLSLPRRLVRSAFVCLLTLAGLAAQFSPVRAQTLGRELYRRAPEILKILQEAGYKNVGVLKFRVRKGKGKPTDNAGPLNLEVAHRLTVALILKSDSENPLGIIQDASAVAARLPGANHLTEEGRKKLFKARYPLAWGDQDVKPDVFLTGTVCFSDDLREMTVGIVYFDRTSGLKGIFPKNQLIRVKTNSASLTEAGESYLVRGIPLENGKVKVVDPEKKPEPPIKAVKDKKPGPPVLEIKEKKVVLAAQEVKEEKVPFPLEMKEAPIALEIHYGDKPVRLDVRGGRAFIPGPQKGQKVVLVLRRRGSTAEGYGIVLKVNGVNTLGMTRLPDLMSRKWVMEPGDGPYVLQGFQIDKKNLLPFKVLSRQESRAREIDYGADIGTISLVVYREGRGGKNPFVRQEVVKGGNKSIEDDPDFAAVEQGRMPVDRPRNLSALRYQLVHDPKRNLFVEGASRVRSQIRAVPFTPDPEPIMSAVITYYQP